MTSRYVRRPVIFSPLFRKCQFRAGARPEFRNYSLLSKIVGSGWKVIFVPVLRVFLVLFNLDLPRLHCRFVCDLALAPDFQLQHIGERAFTTETPDSMQSGFELCKCRCRIFRPRAARSSRLPRRPFPWRACPREFLGHCPSPRCCPHAPQR